MKYITIFILFFAFGFISLQAQNEKKITIIPFSPPKKSVRPKTSPKRTQPRSVPQKDRLDKAQAEAADTVDDYLKRNSQPRLAPSTSSSAFAATVPGFVAGERSRYQKGETQSSARNVPFSIRPEDPMDQDPRNQPVYPGMAGDAKAHAGMSISFDMNQALALAFSKKARLRAHNNKNRLWEKYPKVVPNDSLVKELNSNPAEMLSVKQQKDSLYQKSDSLPLKDNPELKIKAGALRRSGHQTSGNRGERP